MRQDFVKLDEGRGDLGVWTSGVEIWAWGPVSVVDIFVKRLE